MPPLYAQALALAAVATSQWSPTSPPPHVLFVLIDDWGWTDASWHVNPKHAAGLATPNMETLLRQGVELNRHYAYQVCSPSRTAIQSGRNPIHVNTWNFMTSVRNPKDPISGSAGMPVNMTGLGEVMTRGGYATHFYGKWDAGMATPFHTPLGRGYNKSLCFFHHTNDAWNSSTIGPEAPSKADYRVCYDDHGEFRPRDLWEDDHPAHSEVNRAHCSQDQQEGCKYEDEIFAQRVYDALASHDLSRPLFVFWAPRAVHTPLRVPRAYLERFSAFGPPHGRWERQHYLAMLAWIDDAIGHAMQILLSRGMWDKTLVVVSSDNGGPVYKSGKGGANNWPLKGGKETNWEGGVRVNAFVSGGFLPSRMRGTRSDGLCAVWDWYGTFAALAGVSAWDERAARAGLKPVDSHNLWPMLSGENVTSPRTELAIGTDGLWGAGHTYIGYVGALIHGRYKILVQPVLKNAAWTGPVWPNMTKVDLDSHVQVCGPRSMNGCLYDIIEDPEERVNLARELPDVWHRLYVRLREISTTTFSPNRGKLDPAACTAVAERYDGFWGPWAMLDAWPEARRRAWERQPSSNREAVLLAQKEQEVNKHVVRVTFHIANLEGGGNGTVVLDVHPSWAPLGAERFLELARQDFYNNAHFFRVIPGFVAQFGISSHSTQTTKWNSKSIDDDVVRMKNLKGRVSFAKSGPNARATQVFVNLRHSPWLDRQGFAPFAEVVEGIEMLQHLYGGYGEGAPYGKGPVPRQIEADGAQYLKDNFPKLSRISSTEISETAVADDPIIFEVTDMPTQGAQDVVVYASGVLLLLNSLALVVFSIWMPGMPGLKAQVEAIGCAANPCHH